MKALFLAGMACVILAVTVLLAMPHHDGGVPQVTAEQRQKIVARWGGE
jgi:hypothetical protein